MKLHEFHPEAREEFLASVRYYKDLSASLGRRFVEEFRSVRDLACRFPESGHEIAPQVRRHLFRTFPYGLLYRNHSDMIFITAVMHQSREPGYWQTRT